MWGKIIIPMYRLWLNGSYGLYGPWCPLFSKRPINLISIYLSIRSKNGRGQFQCKMLSYHYRKSHCWDEMVLRPFHLCSGNSYTLLTYLYWTLNPCPGVEVHKIWLMAQLFLVHCVQESMEFINLTCVRVILGVLCAGVSNWFRD